MENEKCYVLQAKAGRASKRRRIELSGLNTSLELRKHTYSKLWSRQEQQINEVVRDINESTLLQILDFINTASSDSKNYRIPAGFITTGSGSITHANLFEQLSNASNERGNNTLVSLTASEASNLKTFLKNLISKVTRSNGDSDTEDLDDVGRRKGPKLLNYDLQRVHLWAKQREVHRIVIAFQDSEAFDIGLLTEVLMLFKSWLDRLPFIVLFGIATSVELWEDRLPRVALKCISGQSFDVIAADEMLEKVFERTVTGPIVAIRLGPTLSNQILQRQRDYTESIDSFTNTLKYAYMCHFHGNPLSVYLCEGLEFQSLTVDHFEAIRNLPSFRRLANISFAESLLEQKQATRVRSLLQSDTKLFQEIISGLEAGQATIVWALGAIRVLQDMRMTMGMKVLVPFSTLYMQALNDELVSSPTIRELLLLIKRAPSDMLEMLLPSIIDTLMTMPASDLEISPDDFGDIQEELTDLLSTNQSTNGPLRSEHDQTHTTLRTTIVAQKVELHKVKSTLSKNDTTYSSLATRFHDLLSSYFSKTLSGLQHLFLHELLFYDQRGPHRDAFTPRPRFAIERALSTPHDYLNCTCCADSKDTLSPSQPPTAILYQLYLETGALINTMDLWSAFRTVVGEEHEDEEMVMALFCRGLAELKYLGLIRGSRKKVDHLAKLAWKGL